MMIAGSGKVTARQSDSLAYFQDRGLSHLSNGSDSAIYYFSKAKDRALLSNDLPQLALSLNRLGLALKNQGNAEDALAAFRQSLQLRRQLYDSSGVASVLNNMGTVYKVTGQLDSALHYALECLHLRERLELSNKLGRSYLNIGNLYNLKQDWPNAMHYYELASVLAVQQEDQNLLALALYNKAALLSETDRCEEAIERFEESLLLQQSLANEHAIARIYNGMGVCLERQEKWERAEENYRQAQKIFVTLNVPEDLAHAYGNLGNVLLKQGNAEEARVELSRGLQIAQEASLASVASEIHLNLYELFVTLEQWEAALEQFQRHSNINDSLNSAESARNFSEIREKYESEKKVRLIESQQAALEQKNTENQVLLYGIALLITFGVSGIVIYRERNRNRRLKAEQRAAKDQERISNLLREKEVESIESMLNGQTLERQRISRDLHDQLGGIMATVKLHFNGLEDPIGKLSEGERQSFEKANQILDVACNEVRVIAHDLASGMLAKFGLLGALEELVVAVEKKAGLKATLLMNHWDERLDDALELDLYRIIQELISNVLRHAQATELSIQFTRNEDELTIVIEDNGVGFDTKEKRDASPSRGLGLGNIENRVYKHAGSLAIDSTPTRGTTVIIEIPLSN